MIQLTLPRDDNITGNVRINNTINRENNPCVILRGQNTIGYYKK